MTSVLCSMVLKENYCEFLFYASIYYPFSEFENLYTQNVYKFPDRYLKNGVNIFKNEKVMQCIKMCMNNTAVNADSYVLKT